jgi:hypothetical protein
MKTIHLIVKTLIILCIIGAGILVFAGSPEGPFFFLDTASLAFVVLGAAAMRFAARMGKRGLKNPFISGKLQAGMLS